ncbi:sigma-E factor negative regulatory protein [Arenimonas sp. MALMAid1274]|uniref:sigma-E factor negative regulatory protein n=1 Tax=Arenimonas sp. MALMAid1274 TaxID=3411630 RepID=UPI003BA015B0
MTPIPPDLLQDLCAWMDGELPEPQARFLQRRLEHDPELRGQWERWQLASACLRGQPVRPMPAALAPAIAAAIAGERVAAPGARRWPWLAGAAAAVFAAALLPGLLAEAPGPGLAPSPELAAQPGVPVFEASPMPPAPSTPVDAATSVRDFPLAEVAGGKPWPRSPLAPDGRSMEAYLVRHNALMAEDGLGGFMPYVDVVAHATDEASGSQENAEQ